MYRRLDPSLDHEVWVREQESRCPEEQEQHTAADEREIEQWLEQETNKWNNKGTHS